MKKTMLRIKQLAQRNNAFIRGANSIFDLHGGAFRYNNVKHEFDSHERRTEQARRMGYYFDRVGEYLEVAMEKEASIVLQHGVAGKGALIVKKSETPIKRDLKRAEAKP